MEVIAKYREASPWLRREFTLYPSKVVVAGRVFGGKEFETHVSLKELCADIGLVRFRSRVCVGFFMLFVVLSGFLWLFVSPFQMPPLTARVVVTAILAMLCLVFGLAYYPKYTAYCFLNNSGVLVLDVIEAGPDKQQCREFVTLISKSITESATKPA